MQQIILDSNIILDIALERMPFNKQAITLLSCIKNNKINAFITASSVTDIYYILRKTLGHHKAIKYLLSLFSIVNILETNSEIILEALHSG